MLSLWTSTLFFNFAPLLLTILQGASAAPTDVPSAASFYIPSIPHIHQYADHPLTMFGGHLSADPNLASASKTDVTPHIYFFMVKNRRTADRERIVFWFNGGPGCSSFDGAMMEVGPWRWDGKSEHDFYVKEGGWEEYSTVVFVDQPAGTGFSYTSTEKYIHTMDVAQSQFLQFLRNFYQVFPEYKNVDTYFAGESFAGQWIPYYADAVLNSTLNVPFKGVAIGNGWIDSKHQYPSYMEYALKTALFEEPDPGYKDVKEKLDACVAHLQSINDNPMLIEVCQAVLRAVMKVRSRVVNGKHMCINIYDIRLEDTAPACGMNWPPEMPQITNFLGRPEVVKALHAEAHPGSWRECRTDVHLAFHETTSESSSSVLPRVLSKIPVLIFAGDQDLICNYIGLENMIRSLTWNGGTGLGTVQTQSWAVNSVPAGTWVASRNLTYVKIFNGSHMAPWDVPHVTHDMMLRFMGMNFSAIVDGSARIPSTIGNEVKPVFVEQHQASQAPVTPAKTPEQDKAMWEAYYNAGSAGIVLVLVFAVIGTFVWCRIRRRRALSLPLHNTEDEAIPLNTRENESEEDVEETRQRKGKERAREPFADPPIFDVGDSDEEDYKQSSTNSSKLK
ncbi:alpha/beta-hydrolase [Gymnopilus junonius]|uniref:Pheromone-processing carboxypeptidase KEX1 n=1 Tax=Gymnopilus junonius TaxID=109634 RepID=A0A9P5NZA3_GYMJU|nr:alpha/beta-hydrolase [Gymnopilus junonius]